MKYPFIRISDSLYEIGAGYRKTMAVPARFFLTEAMLASVSEDKSIEQLINVAGLPGIIGYAVAMPDMHQGYGFPIGGVAAFDAEKGIISPGGVGYDINCGVRVLLTDLDRDMIKTHTMQLNNSLYSAIPTGAGLGGLVKLNDTLMERVLHEGAQWAAKNGFGDTHDLNAIEDNGTLECGDVSTVSRRARDRGMQELGSLGSGNHFLEIGYIDTIFDNDTALRWGIRQDQVVVQLHCGSRGLGHQVCTDYVKLFQRSIIDQKIQLPDRELVYAPFASSDGKDYFNAMNAAANFAFANREVLTDRVRTIFDRVLKKHVSIRVLYDVAHNIAKKENVVINGTTIKAIVHRKGATRAFGAGHHPGHVYNETGQPVLIPGTMGTYSYICVGTKKAEETTFGSSCHGAGRAMSRTAALKSFNGRDITDTLAHKGICVQTGSLKGLAEEAPQAYKDVRDVVRIVADEGIVRQVARIRPIAVIKG